MGGNNENERGSNTPEGEGFSNQPNFGGPAGRAPGVDNPYGPTTSFDPRSAQQPTSGEPTANLGQAAYGRPAGQGGNPYGAQPDPYAQPASHGQQAPYAGYGTTPAGSNPTGQFAAPGAPYATGPQSYPAATGAAPATKSGGRSGGFKAGLAAAAVVVALVAGGVGGVVGANISDNASGSSSSSDVLGGDRDTSQPVSAPEGSTQEVAQKVLPSVVSIKVIGSQASGSGSGVVLTEDGTIMTNNHVVAGAGSNPQVIVVFSDGSTADATIVGADPISDIAVIKVDKSGLTPIQVGTSDNLAVGQEVIAIGAPLGLDGTVTTGIISALNRPVSTQGEESGQASVMDAIQTDAAINPGNSGGALVNANGALIGVNSAIASLSEGETGGSIGLGFAIPVNQAMRIADELEQTGKATQAGLGVSVRSGAPAADQPGALISEVQPGGAAADAGIPNGALVTAVNDRVIASGDALIAAIRSHAPGDKVKVTYEVNGQSKTVEVTLDTLDTGGR
ncbi:S1C family serine protease [Williamsia sp.]|uniref:S1C family serine protease n=1 Tax=Williamsia sp. TaxID=1872085 RepID=UPI002F94B3E6